MRRKSKSPLVESNTICHPHIRLSKYKNLIQLLWTWKKDSREEEETLDAHLYICFVFQLLLHELLLFTGGRFCISVVYTSSSWRVNKLTKVLLLVTCGFLWLYFSSFECKSWSWIWDRDLHMQTLSKQ